MLKKSLSEELKETYEILKNSLDLSKTSYKINKNLFRVTLILILALLVGVILTDGFSILTGQAYSCCPKDAKDGSCENFYYDAVSCPINNDLCNIEFISAGECIGDVPSNLAKNFNWIVVFLVLGAFLLNHLNNIKRSKK